MMVTARGGRRGSVEADAHDIVEFPPLQRQMIDWLAMMRARHTVHGLFEVDITDARRAIREWRATTGFPLSLTAFVIACLATAVARDRTMHACRADRGHLIRFNDVDVNTVVEHRIDGAAIPVPHIIRAANTKSLREIQRELDRARAEPSPLAAARRWLPLWLLLPAALRRFVWSRVLSNPYRRKRLTGTVTLTSLGMFASGTGWGVPLTFHPLCLTVGGIVRRPVVVDGRVETREHLCLTVSVDHDTIDGAPTARFVRRLSDLIQDGAGLRDDGPVPHRDVAAALMDVERGGRRE